MGRSGSDAGCSLMAVSDAAAAAMIADPVFVMHAERADGKVAERVTDTVRVDLHGGRIESYRDHHREFWIGDGCRWNESVVGTGRRGSVTGRKLRLIAAALVLFFVIQIHAVQRGERDDLEVRDFRRRR